MNVNIPYMDPRGNEVSQLGWKRNPNSDYYWLGRGQPRIMIYISTLTCIDSTLEYLSLKNVQKNMKQL